MKLRVLSTLLALSASAAALTLVRQDMPTPGAEHAELLGAVGIWEGTLTNYMGGESEPIPAKETVIGIGGFWTQATFECDLGGFAYTGTGCQGFDQRTGKYVGTWIDNSSSNLAVMEGTPNDAGNVVMRWEAPDPMTGEVVPHWQETARPSENEYISTFYAGKGEGEKTMVIHMKRNEQKTIEANSKR